MNKSKTKLRKPQITFRGHKVSCNGLMPDPVKVEAVLNMDPPADVASIQKLAGMVNYLGKFSPNLSDAVEPVRQ